MHVCDVRIYSNHAACFAIFSLSVYAGRRAGLLLRVVEELRLPEADVEGRALVRAGLDIVDHDDVEAAGPPFCLFGPFGPEGLSSLLNGLHFPTIV